MSKTIYQLDSTASVNRDADYLYVGQPDKERRVLIKDIAPVGGIPEDFDITSPPEFINLASSPTDIMASDYLGRSILFNIPISGIVLRVDFSDLIGQTVYLHWYFQVAISEETTLVIRSIRNTEYYYSHVLSQFDTIFFLNGWHYIGENWQLYKI